MLKWLDFKNFKALADVRVELDRFTVLVGPNACGKTTVLKGAELMGSLLDAWPGRPQFARRWLEGAHNDWRSIRERPNISIRATDDDSTFLELLLAPEAVVITTSDAEGRRRVELKKGGSESASAQPSTEWLRAVFLRIYPEIAAANAYSDELEPTLGFGGENLPVVLANFRANDPGTFERIRDDLRRVVPQVSELHMPRRKVQAQFRIPDEARGLLDVSTSGLETRARSRVEMREVIGHGLQLVIDGRLVEAEDASEGTLRTLAVLTAIHSGPRADRRLALVDDLDQALHPSAQLEFVKALRDLLELHPNLQIIATTHSPYLLDAFEESEVQVLNRDADGRTVCRPLSAHPEWPKWKGKLQLGEFWSSTGEDWVLDTPSDPEAA